MPGAYKIELSTSSININKEYLCRRGDRKAVDQVGAYVLYNSRTNTSIAGLTHVSDMLVHARPMVSLSNSIVGLVDIQIPTNGVSVKSYDNDVDQ